METIVSSVKTALALQFLNYQYGYITELNETMSQWSKSTVYEPQKFPCVWLMQPFTIDRKHKEDGIYGRVSLRVFIIQQSTKQAKAKKRMTDVFKPVIYPIYRELLNQLDLSVVFATANFIPHDFTDNYYWGEAQESVLNDVIDCSEISQLQLSIYDNPNCTPFKN